MSSDFSTEVGSAAWLERTNGHLSDEERAYLLRGVWPMIRDGFRLRRQARQSSRFGRALDPFEPPETAIVKAARAHLEAHCKTPMVNHSFRTAFWTLAVLDVQTEITPKMIETTWVAALLHDVGLESPRPDADFSVAGVEVLKALAHEHAWSDEQTHQAAEAIAVNLSTRVDPARFGAIAWAMNVGGAGELGIWPHRDQMAAHRTAELETVYTRDGFRRLALDLIRSEVERLPTGRFALFEPLYWLLMR